MTIKSKKMIGVIHLLPTLGFKGFKSKEDVLSRALEDLEILTSGGINTIIIENNYDLPHEINVSPETIVIMSYVLGKIREKTDIELGISVLWNDYKAALSMAKIYNCQFVRVPVFVDTVKTSFGLIKGDSQEVIKYRNKIDANNIKIYTDVQVKHAELINKRPIEHASIEAVKNGADGLIITGKWTGDAPLLDDLKNVRNNISKDIPVIVGSGADENNVNQLLKYSDSIIISTSLKEGVNQSLEKERNIKNYETKISLSKIKKFMSKLT